MSDLDRGKHAEKDNDAGSSSGSEPFSLDRNSQKQIYEGKDLDAAYRIVHDNPDVPEPTPEEARRIRNKCLLVMVPFYAMTYHLMYVDKQNIGSASILGLLPGLNIGQNEYNLAVTAFYIAYLLAELPQNFALQRFPMGKWLGINLTIWTGVLFGHLGITNFGGLFGLRFLLGALEACAVPAVLLSENQFFTFKEQSVIHTGIWAFGNSSPITSGLLSYASLFIDLNGMAAYKVFFIIIGAVTGAFAILVFFLFPDGPQNAWFLTDREKVQAVLRTRSNRAGIENKTWKKSQFIEAMKDWKVWAFALHALLQEMGNGFTSQYSIIIKSFGFTTLQTTLLGCLTGVVAMVSILTAALTLALLPNFRAYISFLMYIPVITGAVLGIALPWSNRIGLLIGVYMRSTTGVPYAVVMSWAATTASGHTKKQTTIALYHLAYGLSNSISPNIFRASDAPRFIPAWINLLILAGILPAILVLVIRYFLDRENKRRDALEAEGKGFDGGYVETDGQKQHADSHQLDLTDRENLYFRYVL